MSEHIIVTDQMGVRTIRIDRTDKKNALTFAMYEAMERALRQAETDPALRVVVLTGTGDVFTAGNDLNDFLEAGDVEASPAAAFLRRLIAMPKPVIAAVNGLAIGIGVTLLAHCDLVYGVPGASLQLPFINLALVPEAASSLLLPKLMGYQRAAELLMLGEPFSSETALALGMINALHPADRLAPVVAEIAARLAAKPPNALAKTKALLRLAEDSVDSRLNAEFAAFGQALRSVELKQAIAAFSQRKSGG